MQNSKNLSKSLDKEWAEDAKLLLKKLPANKSKRGRKKVQGNSFQDEVYSTNL